MEKRTLKKSFLLIGLYVALELGFAIINELFGLKSERIFILESIFILLIFVFSMKDLLKGQWPSFKKNYKSYLEKGFSYWACGFVAMMVLNFIIVFLLGDIAPNENANRELLELYPIYSRMSIVLIAPLTEELLFRLNFKNTIKGRYKWIIFTGIVFASTHILFSYTGPTDFLYLIPYASLGIAFSAGFYDTDNIFTSIAMHILHNSICLGVILLGL